jgi:hypothetical protein
MRLDLLLVLYGAIVLLNTARWRSLRFLPLGAIAPDVPKDVPEFLISGSWGLLPLSSSLEPAFTRQDERKQQEIIRLRQLQPQRFPSNINAGKSRRCLHKNQDIENSHLSH